MCCLWFYLFFTPMGSLACRRTRKGCDSKAFFGDFEVFPVSWSVNKHRRLCSVTIQPPPLPLCPEAEAPRTQFWKIEERIHHPCLTHRLPEGNPFLFVSSSNLSLFFFFFSFFASCSSFLSDNTSWVPRRHRYLSAACVVKYLEICSEDVMSSSRSSADTGSASDL